jgi:hypothetical protein
MARTDWSRPPPRPLKIPGVMELRTLADARALMRHLPVGQVERPTCRHVAKELTAAADGGDVADAAIALRLAFMIENIEHELGSV